MRKVEAHGIEFNGAELVTEPVKHLFHGALVTSE